MLTRMEVGDVRYVTTDPNASALMKNSTVAKRSTTQRLTLSDIKAPDTSPFDQCLLLFVAADAYYHVTGEYDLPFGVPHEKPPSGLWKDSIDDLCTNCTVAEDDGIVGMCALCHRFINAEGENTAAKAAVSCSGYEIDLNISSLSGALDLSEEVTDVTKKSNLYLLNVGYQR